MKHSWSFMLLGGLLAVIGMGCDSGDGIEQMRVPTARPGSGVLIVAYDEARTDTMSAPPGDSVVVLNWLRYGCDSLNRTFEIEEYAFGDLVVAIGDTRNGGDGYWLYKVNGEPVPEGVSAHRVATTDTVLFFFK